VITGKSQAMVAVASILFYEWKVVQLNSQFSQGNEATDSK